MASSIAAQVAADLPAARSAVYKLLSVGFRYPTQELFTAFENGEFMEALWENLATLPYLNGLLTQKADRTQRASADLNGVSFRDLEVKYIETFDVGAPEPPFPPYEGVQLKGERTVILLEVSEFYKHFGLQTNIEPGKRELPDHLSVELEFLHFLTFKEAQARGDEDAELLKGYLLAQRDFLERHLLKWLPNFSEKLQKAGNTPLYADLAEVAAAFLKSDFAWVTAQLKDLP